MGRPTTIDNGAILDAARAIFLTRGSRGTSTEIARRAGVSEATVFKRFKTKAELFRAALDVDEEPLCLRELPARIGTATVRSNLFDAAAGILAHLDRALPLWKLQLLHEPRGDGGQRLASAWSKGLASYLAGERAIGRVRDLDVTMAAAGFVGSLLGPILCALPVDRESYAWTCVEMICSGIERRA